MFRKLTFILLAFMLSTAMAVQPYHEIQVVDERGVKVTTITSVEIYAPDTTTDAVIYSDRGEQNAITIPMTTSSTNTTLVDGFMSWYGPDGYDFSFTDGTNIATNANHRTRTSSEGTLVFPSYLTSITTSQYLDAESITMGTSSDFVLNAGTTDDLMTWTPATDGAIFRIGANDAATNSDFRVMVGTDLGLLIDEGVPSFTWNGGAASINASSNFNTSINTGTSSGTVSLGNSAAGAFTFDTAGTYTLSSDGAHSTTTTDAGADITINSSLGTVIIEGEENVADAVFITADGGTTSTLKVFNDTGTSVTEGAESITILTDVGGIGIRSTANLVNAVNITVDNGTTSTMRLFNDTGNASTDRAASIQLDSDVGGIGINAEGSTATTEKASAIQLTADAGAIELYSGLDATGAVKITADGGTDSDVVIYNDQGTSADSIHLLTDVGGITLASSAGLIALDASGASAGDITITAGDDLTLAVTGSLTTGQILFQRYVTVYAGNASLSSAQSGTVLVTTAAAGTQIFQVPTAVVGLTYTFVDISATAGDDLSILPQAGDSVGSSPAFSYYTQTGDSIPSSVTIVAVNSASWAVVAQIGTWIRTDSGL